MCSSLLRMKSQMRLILIIYLKLRINFEIDSVHFDNTLKTFSRFFKTLEIANDR